MANSSILHACSTFDLSVAHLLAHAAAIAYRDGGEIEQTVVGGWGFENFNFFDVDETQCFVASRHKTTIVCFRGTESSQVQDWLTDINCDLMDGPWEGQVHAGFYSALSNIWRVVDRQVALYCGPGTRYLWVTGHSLGAALATLAVARWREMGRSVSGLYAFGQPRVGDWTFSLNFDFDFKPATFRIVNGHDIVTRVAPRCFGYRHVGRFKCLDETGRLVENIRGWRQFLEQWNGAFNAILDWCGHGIEDHGMARYLDNIERAFEQHREIADDGYDNRVRPQLRRRRMQVEPRRAA